MTRSGQAGSQEIPPLQCRACRFRLLRRCHPTVRYAPWILGMQVTDMGVENLVKSMTSLVTLNIMGCHRLTPRAKGQVARLLDNPFND